MEKFRQDPRESGIHEVLAKDEQQAREIWQHFKDRFNEGQSYNDKEHSAELDKQIILLSGFMKEFLSRYNISSIDIMPSAIRIPDFSKLYIDDTNAIKKMIENGSVGFYEPGSQAVGMLIDYDEYGSKLVFLSGLVHEMFHANSFQSVRVAEGGTPESYRTGFKVMLSKTKTLLFHELEEAVIEELTYRFDREYFSKIPEISGDLKYREDLMEDLSKAKNLSLDEIRKESPIMRTYKLDDGSYEARLVYAYKDERKQLNDLIDGLYKRNSVQFASREDVFNLFVEASMAGNLFPIVKLIEKTCGKGSFKLIGEKTKSNDA